MSYDVTIENHGRGALVTWKGHVTGAELLRANEAMYGHDPNGIFEYQIWDFSGAERIDATSGEMRRIALQDYYHSDGNPNQRVAVVGTAEIFSGLDRLYKIFADVWTEFESMTFPTISKAREWIAGATRTE